MVSGSGTGVGKTRVTGALARVAARNGRSVQIIKPVQTGVAPREPTDAEIASQLAGLPPDCAHTLRRYRAALAPASAAAADGAFLKINEVIQEISVLPPVDIRLIEGAGGIAVPLGPQGWDWVEFAEEVHANAMVLVVADELGAINQSRLVWKYTQEKFPKKLPCGIFLNAITRPPSDVAGSSRSALDTCMVPLWGEMAAGAIEPLLHEPSLIKWLKHWAFP